MGFRFDSVIQVVILILALRALHIVSATTHSCADVRRHFDFNKIGPVRAVPRHPHIAKDLKVCPNGVSSCCSNIMENHYIQRAEFEVQESLEMRISSLKYNFKSFSSKFQEDVVETLAIKGNSTRNVLRRLLRKKNIKSHVKVASLREVQHLFLLIALKTPEREIKRSFDRFLDKIFLFLIDEDFNGTLPNQIYVDCVTQRRKDLHMFVNFLSESASNISKATYIARVLHDALPAGAQAVNITSALRFTKSCKESLLRMRYCSHCWGITLIKPCMGLCKNVMRGCLAGLTELDVYWKYYIDALALLAEYMRGSEPFYNLEIALMRFHNQLSFSISAMVDNLSSIRNSVAEHCQKLRVLERPRKSLDADLSTSKDFKTEEDNELISSRLKDHRHGRHRKKSKKSPNQMNRCDVTQALQFLEEDISYIKNIDGQHHQSILPPHEVLTNIPTKRSFHKKQSFESTQKPVSNLHNRIKRFISSLNETIGHYHFLADSICRRDLSFGISVSDDVKCWDGTGVVIDYLKPVVMPGYSLQSANPEVSVLKMEKDVIHSINSLRRTTMEMLNACSVSKIPDILLRLPVFEEREIPEKFQSVNLCDGEEECEMNGSGGSESNRKKKGVSKSKTETAQLPKVKKLLEFKKIGKQNASVLKKFAIKDGSDVKCAGEEKRCKSGHIVEKHNVTKKLVAMTTKNSAHFVLSNFVSCTLIMIVWIYPTIYIFPI